MGSCSDLAALILGSEAPHSNSASLLPDVSPFCNAKARQSIKMLPPNSGEVLLFYKYVDVCKSDVSDLMEWQKKLCEGLLLRGRIHVGVEGINGTVGGATEI